MLVVPVFTGQVREVLRPLLAESPSDPYTTLTVENLSSRAVLSSSVIGTSTRTRFCRDIVVLYLFDFCVERLQIINYKNGDIGGWVMIILIVSPLSVQHHAVFLYRGALHSTNVTWLKQGKKTAFLRNCTQLQPTDTRNKRYIILLNMMLK